MTNGNKNDGGDFDFPDFSEEPVRPVTRSSPPVQRASSNDFDLDEGSPIHGTPVLHDGAFIESMPKAAPLSSRAAAESHAAHEQEDFGDPDGETYHTTMDHMHGNHDPDIEHVESDEHARDNAVETPPRSSLFSRLIVPVGGGAFILMGSYFAWPLVSGFFGTSGSSTPTPTAIPVFQQKMPNIPTTPQSSLPPLPSAGVTAPSLPPLQASQPLPALPRQSGVHVPDGMVTDQSLTVSPELEKTLSAMVTQLTQMNSKLGGFDDRLSGMQSEVQARISKEDQKIDAVGTRIGDIASKMTTIDERLAMLEAGRSAAAPIASGLGSAIPVTSSANRPSRSGVRAGQLEVVSTPPVADTSVGYALRGISRTSALVLTPRGALVQAEVGKRVPGIGVIQEIRKDGETWVLVTSSGTIRP